MPPQHAAREDAVDATKELLEFVGTWRRLASFAACLFDHRRDEPSAVCGGSAVPVATVVDATANATVDSPTLHEYMCHLYRRS
jgi:hypothetical protein